MKLNNAPFNRFLAEKRQNQFSLSTTDTLWQTQARHQRSSFKVFHKYSRDREKVSVESRNDHAHTIRNSDWWAHMKVKICLDETSEVLTTHEGLSVCVQFRKVHFWSDSMDRLTKPFYLPFPHIPKYTYAYLPYKIYIYLKHIKLLIFLYGNSRRGNRNSDWTVLRRNS